MRNYQLSAISLGSAVDACFQRKASNIQLLVVDSPLSQYTLRVRVFHLAHLRDQVGQFHQLRMRVPPRANYVYPLREESASEASRTSPPCHGPALGETPLHEGY